MTGIALRAEALRRVFSSPAGDVVACDGIDLELCTGELLVVRGASGAGKTTLLNLLGTLDTPTSGRVVLGDVDTTGLAEAELAPLRRENLGFVFQSFGLIPVLSARENVELPLRIAGVDASERNARTQHALELVGLAGHSEQRPSELSGGQQQRVGIARAIVSRPRILIADEPTGQLDSRTAATIMDLLGELAHHEGLAAIVSTHDPLLVARADRVVEIHDGRIAATSATAAGAESVAAAVAVAGAPPAPGSEPAAAPTTGVPLTRAELRRRAGL